jgi:exodeoxyribonuclease-3
MRVISLNANGLRAAARKGFYEWLPGQNADFVCLQEVRAQPEQLDALELVPAGYHCFYEPGENKGRSGVAVFTRDEPDEVIHGFGSAEFDPEGRYLEVRFGNLSIASVYVPSGSSSKARQAAKFRFMEEFSKHLTELATSGRDCIVCGDWNVAHKAIDLENDRANQKQSGFLPEERAWLDQVFGPAGFVDTFRELNTDPAQYTWWSNRHPTARERNVGWRLDYQAATQRPASRVRSVAIASETRFSDRAPLIFDYALEKASQKGSAGTPPEAAQTPPLIPDLRFDVWKEKLLSVKPPPSETDPRRVAPQLRVYEDERLSAYYTPFFHEVLGAPLAFCGLTPGLHQWGKAIAIAHEGLQRGVSDEEIGVLVQNDAAFAGQMRTNLVSMLNELGLAQLLGLSGLDQAFNGGLDVHMTSLLRAAVFRNGKNYSGSPAPSKHPFLRELVLRYCGPELARVQPKLIVPLGKAVEDGLKLLVDGGVVSEAQCLWGFPHPSGANGHRIRQFREHFDEMRKIVLGINW